MELSERIIDDVFLDELRMFYDAIDHEKEGQEWRAEDSGKSFADGSPTYIVKSDKGIVSYPQSLEVAVFISCAHNNWETILGVLKKGIEVAQLESSLATEKQKHLDTANWAEEQQNRADRAESSLVEAREEIERLNGVLNRIDEMTKHIEFKVENVEHKVILLITENKRLREIVGAYHPEYFNNCPCPQCSDDLEETV